MLTARGFTVLGSVAVVASVSTLGATVGMGAAGWLVGLICGATLITTLAASLDSQVWPHLPGPADLVTLTRAVIACALAALTAEALLHRLVTPWFVPLTVVALLLDAVDGQVARRTGTSSSFGSRFDGEVDAFLILVLSVQVAPVFGAWTLTGGLMRYVFGTAAWMVPWMRGRLPYRYWRKVVTAAQGVALATAAADVLPRWASTAGLVLGLALLSESFARDIVWLWNARAATHRADADGVIAPVRPERRTEAV